MSSYQLGTQDDEVVDTRDNGDDEGSFSAEHQVTGRRCADGGGEATNASEEMWREMTEVCVFL